jgi:trehalose/maltose hydrolase-like predicted phosphorylase
VPPFGVLAETAGGMLQAVLNGLGGLDITDSGITQLKTKLPKKWKSLTIKGVGPQLKTIQVQ